MKIYESGENYLEAIYMISKKQNTVRAVDICTFFEYSRPTVSAAVKKLKDSGFLTVDENNFINLTKSGMKIAESMFERHNIIAQAFICLGVDEKTAFTDSCKVEHCLSEKTYECIKKHYNNHKKH